MKEEVIVRPHTSFEELVQKDEQGGEFWLARDRQSLLEYAKWENFAKVIGRARTAYLFARYCAPSVRFTHWRGKKDREVDLVAEVGGQIIPFEVKYRAQHTGASELKGLIDLCQQKNITRGYVVTKSMDDFGLMTGLPQGSGTPTQIMRIPAPLLCYWMGASELNQHEIQN